MKNEIINNLDNPGSLEQLYRHNKKDFKTAFFEIYPQLEQSPIAEFWLQRLNYESETISWGSRSEIFFILVSCLIAGLLAKLPDIFGIDEEFFYSRNIGFLVFPFLIAYFFRKNKIDTKKIIILSIGTLISLLYINFLPNSIDSSDTLLLACIHLPVLLWFVLGISFTGFKRQNPQKWLEYLSFNGDLLVMSAILILAGILTTGITLGLFNLIGLQIEDFYFRYVVIFGLPAVPIFASFLTQTNPQLVRHISPVIARIFSPLVLLMLIIYLGAIIYSGKDPYNDREFLLIFNLLLAGVIALIFFSVAGNLQQEKTSSLWVLLPLSAITIIINGVALSAIVFRISEWGFTPNRLAVLGANILFLIHLTMVMIKLFQILVHKQPITAIENSIAGYLPVYLGWAALVVFIFPLLFGFN
ncbi:hypothetical protein C7S20_01150 [Christiangramia fulva]|uniref:DUF4153 domain-containing protein n=1 Tax=Christiangramia fulva TaxID=2126553 RepID=A0A2R3Z146_9FLAO|nr:DUF4153 domain-containing protein [Christiangramia fulva]AVR43982.1 hypothetical protein C7S20_01150 [Christiangramia fulva]